MVSAPLRWSSRLLATLLVLAFSFGALGATAAPPAAAEQTAGVQAHLLWSRYDAADRERMLDRAKGAGVGMVRVDLGWASLEQDGKGRYNAWYLQRIDHVVDQAEARGIEVLFTLWETPCWASTAPAALKQGCAGNWWEREVQRYPPANASDFGDALAFLTNRYGRRVAAWEIWNEPNHDHFFKARDKVSAYAALVKAAYPAAKAADPGSTILAGSLADSDYQFTEALLDKGVADKFDAWSVHPYSEDRSPLHPGIPGWEKKSFAQGVPAVRRTLLRHGQVKPIWLTEFGWSTCTIRGQAAYENCVDPATQATYLQQAFRHMRSWSYVPVGITFNLVDTSDNRADRVDNYGLLHENGAAKPAYTALRTAATALRRAPAPPVARAPSARQRPRGLLLRVFRRNGRSYVAGHLPVGRTVRVKLHRWKRSIPRFSHRVSYNQLIRVEKKGRFRHRISLGATRNGKWLVVAKARRLPGRAASAVLR